MSDIEGEPDLGVDPPPDLTVEAVHANPPENSLAVYLELGVPEVWVFPVKKPALEFLHLGADGRYAAQPASRS